MEELAVLLELLIPAERLLVALEEELETAGLLVRALDEDLTLEFALAVPVRNPFVELVLACAVLLGSVLTFVAVPVLSPLALCEEEALVEDLKPLFRLETTVELFTDPFLNVPFELDLNRASFEFLG